ncbi:MAG: hypothetical protein ACP5US_05425, partial [Candidatus Kryptoniota bacterium]
MNAFKLTIIYRKYFVIPAMLVSFVSSGKLSSQTATSADKFSLEAYLAYKKGNISLSREYLDSAHNTDPYAMYVRAALTENAKEAADIYSDIVSQNRNWPVYHDALMQLYNYHYAIGDYKSAHLDYVALQKFPLAHQIIDPVG